MVYFSSDFDHMIANAAFVLVGVALAAWALRVACSFSSVHPPSFLQAVLTVILICITNVVLHFFTQATQISPGLGSHLISPLLGTAAIIALTVRTGALSAVIVTISFVSICGGVYYSLSIINGIMIAMIA